MAIPTRGETADGTSAARPTRLARLRTAAAARGVPLAAIIVAVAVVSATYLMGKLIYRLRDIVLLMVVAGFIALLLNPLVLYLQRWRIRRRGLAVTVVTVWAALVFIGLVAAFGYPLVNGLTHFSHQLPSYVSSAEQGHGWIGQLLRRLHLQAWVTKNAPKLQSLGGSLAKPALTVGKGAVSLLAELGTIAALMVLFLLEGPKMRKVLLSLPPPERSQRYAQLAAEINQSVAGDALGNLLTSLIAGLVVFITLAALGVPFPALWGLWVALVDFLPMIGGALAGIPEADQSGDRTLPTMIGRRRSPGNGAIGLLVFAVGQIRRLRLHWSDQGFDESEDLMKRAETGLAAAVGTAERSGTAGGWAPFQMLDGTDGAARLVFESISGRRHVARLERWIAVIRLQRSAVRAARVVWLLDARTVRWSGGLPPSDLYRGATGLNAEETPILWFRAGDGDDDGGLRAFTVSGVFGAAGIMDAARVRVGARRIRREVRLRMAVDPQMWGLSAGPAGTWTAPGPELRIIAAGIPRPLDSDAIKPWM